MPRPPPGGGSTAAVTSRFTGLIDGATGLSRTESGSPVCHEAVAGQPDQADLISTATASRAAPDGPVTARGRRTRERVVDAARRVFEGRGFSDTRMSDIAECAGVSHGTIYVYFDSKHAILHAVVAQLLIDLGKYLRANGTDDPVRRISEANLRYLEVYTRHARLLQVVEQVATSDPEFAEILSDFRAKHVARVADGIRKLQQDRHVDPQLDAGVSAAALSAMVEGYARHSPGYRVEDVHPTLTSLWLRALGLSDPPGDAHDTTQTRTSDTIADPASP